jgi:Cdc6-like AAA superfamily ATPase
MKRKEVRITLLVSLGILSTLLSSVLVNIVTSQESPLKHLPLPLLWLIVGLVTTMLIGLAIYDRLQSGAEQSFPQTVLLQRERQNRLRLLERVRNTWIKGLLDHSLYDKAHITLNLRIEPDALADPWHLSVQQHSKPMQSLPADTLIIQVYDDAQGELLILGEPGSGKTTVLLQLTSELLDRAEREESHPIPVVFNLSSWAVKRQPLLDWLVEELNSRYQVPRKLAQAWVSTDQILPLLDGLDEMASTHRAACTDSINVYRHEHGSVPTVVCSRTADYFAQANRLQLQRAVIVQPLTDQQVDAYLMSGGEPLVGVHMALLEDAVLRELATTPLVLNILALAYQGYSDRDRASILTGSFETRRQQIFKIYIQRMLERREAHIHYTPQQAIQWLRWLAVQLVRHSQTEFYLEELQPDWLPRAWTFRLASGVLTGLILGAASGLVVGLSIGLAGGLVFGLGIGLGAGLGIGLETTIHPAEILFWSWRNLRRSLLLVLIGSLTAGLIAGLISTLLLGTVGLVIGLVGAPVVGLLGGLVFGLSRDMLEKSNRLRPNQGIRRSARNGLFFGLVCGPLFGLISGLGIGMLSAEPVLGLGIGLGIGLTIGIGGGLLFGGEAYFQHSTLRLLLWQTGCAPLRYVRFLDDAVSCILLRKIGGGYIFIHRQLLDYFASQESTGVSPEAERLG